MQQVTLHVSVEQHHIDRGNGGSDKHPLTLAIREAAKNTPPFLGKGLGGVDVERMGVTMQMGTADHWHVFYCEVMPESVYEFIERYGEYGKQSVEPFSFSLILDGLELGSPKCSGCVKASAASSFDDA